MRGLNQTGEEEGPKLSRPPSPDLKGKGNHHARFKPIASRPLARYPPLRVSGWFFSGLEWLHHPPTAHKGRLISPRIPTPLYVKRSNDFRWSLWGSLHVTPSALDMWPVLSGGHIPSPVFSSQSASGLFGVQPQPVGLSCGVAVPLCVSSVPLTPLGWHPGLSPRRPSGHPLQGGGGGFIPPSRRV